MSKQVLWPLEKLVKHYPIPIIDACTLQRFHERGEQSSYNLSEKIRNLGIEIDSANFFLTYLKRGEVIYTISGVLKEYCIERAYNYKRKIKKKGTQKNSHMIGYYRKKDQSFKKRKQLVEVIKDGGMVLDLKDKEKALYSNFFAKYNWLVKKHDLSDTDYELLITGATLCWTRKFVALLSFDFDLGNAWKEIMRDKTIRRKRFGFFIRTGLDDYRFLL